MATQLLTARRVLFRTLSGGRKSSPSNECGGESAVPKGHLAVYVGTPEKKRMVVPVAFLNHHLFRELLQAVEEEFGFDHPMGGITIPCSLDYFLAIISMIEASS